MRQASGQTPTTKVVPHMAGRDGDSLAPKVLLVVGGIAATMLARRAVGILWIAATGRHAPDDPSDPEIRAGEAVAFAVLTGALVGVARLLVERKSNQIKIRQAAEVA